MTALPSRADFLALIGSVRANGAIPDAPLLAVYDALRGRVEELETHLGKAKEVNHAHQQDAIKHRAKIESLERHVSTLEKELFKPDSAEVERGK